MMNKNYLIQKNYFIFYKNLLIKNVLKNYTIFIQHEPVQQPIKNSLQNTNIKKKKKEHSKFTEEIKKEIKKLRKEDPENNTQRALAKKFNISRLLVARYAKCPKERKEKIDLEMKTKPLQERTHYIKTMTLLQNKKKEEKEKKREMLQKWLKENLQKEKSLRELNFQYKKLNRNILPSSFYMRVKQKFEELKDKKQQPSKNSSNIVS